VSVQCFYFLNYIFSSFYFNTTLVSVQSYFHLRAFQILFYFNTTLVSVQWGVSIYYSSPYLISIQLLCRFNLTDNMQVVRSDRFQYNSCVGSIFFVAKPAKAFIIFQYNSCVGSIH